MDLNTHESRNIEFFKNIFLKVLNKHAPIKTKYLRANHSPYLTKELSKTIMLRSKLWNQYLKCKSEEARARFKIQTNLCVTLLRKARRDYNENLELGKVNDSKKFWNTLKSVLGNKVTTKNNINLIENEKVATSKIDLSILLILSPSKVLHLLFLAKQRLRKRKSICYYQKIQKSL